MPRATRESPMWRASGTERASRSSLGTTRGSPERTAARAWARPGGGGRGPGRALGVVQAGAGATGAGQALVEVDPVVRDAERGQGLALGGEVLQDGGAPGVADEFAHPGSVSFSPRSPDY